MKKTKCFVLILSTFSLFTAHGVAEGEKAHVNYERGKVGDAYKWRIEDLYPSVKAWERDLAVLRSDLKEFANCKGKLNKGDLDLASCLKKQFEIIKRNGRIKTYADLMYDQDHRDVKGQELHQRAERAGTAMRAVLSFVEPEILEIPPKKLTGLLQKKNLGEYRQYIDNITRRRSHVLSPIAEQTIARSGDLANLPGNVYMTVSNVNAPAPVVTLSDGQKVEMTRTGYLRYRSSLVRGDRIKVFKAFWGTYQNFRETYASLLSGVVSRDHYYAKVRKYNNDLESALDKDNIPISLYTNMIKQVRSGRHLLWRYLKIRKKLLGLAELGYHDLYTSINPSLSVKYPWSDTRKALLNAAAPLGQEYHAVMKKALDERWIDVFPTQGKRSNANTYASTHGVHPYIILNHNDDYMSLTMAAHELGNASHVYLAGKYQKIQNATPPNIVTLVASNVNENLIRLYLYSQETDRQKKLFLLGQYLENWRQVLFRQALFSEFELSMHQLAQAGASLSADRLDKVYLKLLKEYYGEARGVCQIDPLYAVEWAYISNIYRNFFVYQYSASFIASATIAEKIFSGDTKAREAYLSMLKAGGSKYPTDLLKMASVDLSSPRPYRDAFKVLDRVLDEVEKLMSSEESDDVQVAQLERSQVDKAYKWDLTDMYASTRAWNRDLKRLNVDLKKFARCKGTLGKSSTRLASCLDKLFNIQKRKVLLSSYATRLYHQDAKGISGQEMYERIGKVETRVAAITSFVEPEILSIPPKRLSSFGRAKKLADYRHYLDNITRLRDHVLSPLEEEIIARAGDLANLPQNVYMTASTLNVPYPTVTMKDGRQIRMTQAMYSRYRAVPDREERIKVFKAFWGTYQKYRETYASLMAGVVSRDHYIASVRKYKNDLESALGRTNVPTSIYTNMIKQVRAARPLLWRYLRLRKELLGLTDLGYHDMYTSLVPSVDLRYDYPTARKTILKAMALLGSNYIGIMKKAFDDRWTDVYPTSNKRSGAYMSGEAYDVHPYVLLNYNDNYDSMSTVSHEFGHAAHSYLANRHQKYHNADYPIFIAEVAAIVNENLLRLYVLEKETEKKKKLALLGQYLDNWRTTVFRQAIFAEFELKLHEMAQQGIPLTADLLGKTYLQLLREYYGESEGVCKIDPLYAVEWAYIAHFYYNFYMFQYTTSFIASTAIAQKMYSGDEKTRDDYLSMLRAGGSKYPVDLLKMAGVDLRESKPYEIAFDAMKQALDQIEALK